MKKYLWLIASLFLINHTEAQPHNDAARLAIVPETTEAGAVADVLTAEFSKNDRVQLLERAEIERVFREQGLSAGNRDDLKLGRILGADGLLLLETHVEAANPVLNVRLVAVKPGVVLTAEKFSWPLKQPAEWSAAFANRLDPFLPKLTVLAKDAIPISIVNLRSALQSDESKETERQLKLLTIQRLSQERQLFVLERQRMPLLSEEKELQADESAFWNGSYLLEGVVDQNGYSKETVTLNARLTPPKGGAPLLIEASGSRTNLAEVINRLVVKVGEVLKINSSVKEWSAADEAAQYFEEAKWALKWGVFSEAQAAADAAWTLGKTDMQCARVRINAYLNEVAAHGVGYNSSEHIYSSETDENGKVVAAHHLEDADVQADIRAMKAENPFGLAYAVHRTDDGLNLHFVFADRRPNPEDIDRASHTLELYDAFCRSQPNDAPQTNTSRERDDWYRLGANSLTVASQVLRDFYFVPQAANPMAEKLTQLRALARRVAEDIPNASGGMECKVAWGALWQDKPEDAIVFYQSLMGDPDFNSAHPEFWCRGLLSPRLVAWNARDQQRLPAVWHGFVRELDQSTNIFMRMEADALRFADAQNDQEMTKAFDGLWGAIFSNRELFVTNLMGALLNWGPDRLFGSPGEDAYSSPVKESLRERFRQEYQPKLNAMNEEYRQNQAYAVQKQFLLEKQPYEFVAFTLAFRKANYTRIQAEEIQPLLTAYKSNVVAQAAGLSGAAKFKLQADMRAINSLETDIDHILNQSQPAAVNAAAHTPALRLAKPMTAPMISKQTNAMETNILQVRNYLKIPLEQIPLTDIRDFKIYSSRWTDGNLLVDIRFTGASTNLEAALRLPLPALLNQNPMTVPVRKTGGVAQIMAAVFSPLTSHWEIRAFPDGYSGLETFRLLDWNKSGLCFDLFQDDFYFSEGAQINRYDRPSGFWKGLRLPGLDDSRLFVVGGHFYAANSEGIFEITGRGTGVKILASTRRRPAASALDSLDSLNAPVLFSGPDRQLCASVDGKIYCWDGNDWKEPFSLAISRPLEIFDDAVVLRSVSAPGPDNLASLWVWEKGSDQPKLCLRERPKPRPGAVPRPAGQSDVPTSAPRWQAPRGEYLTESSAVYYQSNLYFFVDHAEVVNLSGQWTVQEKDGCHARLVCLCPDMVEPITVPLKFELSKGRPPLKSLGKKFERAPWLTPETWMHFAGNRLYIGQAGTPGVWAIPSADIEMAVAAQKKLLQEEKQQREQRRRDFAALDPEHKEAEIGNSQFLELELPDIDANHNGLLDAGELRFFDVNTKGIFGSFERDALDKTLELFADRLMEQLPQNQEGKVNPMELPMELLSLFTPAAGRPAIPVGRDKLLDLMREHLNRSLAAQNRDSYISLPSGVTTNLTNFSITVWINLVSASTWTRVFDFGSSTANYMLLTPKSETGAMRFAITTSGKSGEQQINGTSAWPVGGWHHVAVTLNDGVGILYLDGAPVGTNKTMTLTPASLGNTTQNWIGKSQWPDPYLNGAVDEFRIYGRALSSGEIAALNAPMTNVVDSLIITNALLTYLKFDESGGTTALDSTGHGWKGMLMNGSSRVAGHDNDAVWLDNSASGLPGMISQQLVDPKLRFKLAVEACWRSAKFRDQTTATASQGSKP